MKWHAKWMIDPGDGIVSEADFEHECSELSEVATACWNGEIDDVPHGEHAWLFSLEAKPS